MDKKIIFTHAKKKMAMILDELNYDNMLQTKKSFDFYFDFLHDLNKISSDENVEVVREVGDDSVSEFSPKHIGKEEIGLNQRTISDDVIGKEFRFERRLRGGIIDGLEGSYSIPERMVRDMGVDNGDIVRVVKMRKDPVKNQYWFDIVEKKNEPMNERVQLNLCLIEKDFDRYIIRKNSEGVFLYDNKEVTFYVDVLDVEKMDIKEGDIVDIAFYKNDPFRTMKVIYKHDIGPADGVPKGKTINKSPRERQESKETVLKPQIDASIFKNKKVCLVGGFSRNAEYKEALSRLGASLEQLTGKESTKRLEATISRANVVGILYKECSHYASQSAVELCKKMNIPFSSTGNTGVQSMLLCLQEAVTKAKRVLQVNGG